MTTINSNTKISTLLKHPDALEVIISISPKFNKLRNPILRKLMAARTSIGMASKVGGCSVNDFFTKLAPLGFDIDKEVVIEEEIKPINKPDFVKNSTPQNTIILDVRSDIESGKDPLSLIMKAVKPLKQGEVLKLINSFEPTPLIGLLAKQGFQSYAETISDNQVDTYFYKTDATKIGEVDTANANDGWDERLLMYKDNLVEVDVRHLEMPMPMITILEALDTLPNDKALYVTHKRIPVFLLPELATRKLEYRIKEVADGEVYLLIYKP